MTTWRVILAAGVLTTTLVACSDEGKSTGEATTAASTPAPTEPTDTAAPDTSVPDTTTPDTTAPETTDADAVGVWETIVAPPDCMCGDGSEFSYFVRTADPTKVVFFLEGGGACFSADTCKPESNTYKRDVGYEGGFGADGDPTGIFDFSDPMNPFADYSFVFVPYCTGDVHIGNNTKDYGGGVVVQHKGYVNGSTALDKMAELFPDATELVVTGESAGSVPTPLYAGMAADLLPAARITVLADGSGAYPDIPGINAVIGDAWGTMNAIPDWPENAGVTPETWSLPGLFVKAGAHDPDITFARHDYAFDQTQTFFAGLAGIPADDLVSLIDRNEAQIEAGGVDLLSYITPGDSHTVLHKADFYTETVNGTLFVDWVTALISGETVADVHCTVCTTS
ncbi:MAG: pectin acetylesterase-family hydrolase [Ilumatobacteraceae bacterium]